MHRLFKTIGVVSIVALTLTPVAESSAKHIRDLADKDLCQSASDAWVQGSNFADYLAEAAKRGLTGDACRQLLGKEPFPPISNSSASTSNLTSYTTDGVCSNALNSERTAWNQSPNFSMYVAEAKRLSLPLILVVN